MSQNVSGWHTMRHPRHKLRQGWHNMRHPRHKVRHPVSLCANDTKDFHIDDPKTTQRYMGTDSDLFSFNPTL